MVVSNNNNNIRTVPWALWLLLIIAFSRLCLGQDGPRYGVDVSFPIHHPFASDEPNQLGDRALVYRKYMEGCQNRYQHGVFSSCESGEEMRLSMSLRQPSSVVNFTSTGFTKVRAPEDVMKLLVEHWEKNKDRKVEEKWSPANVYTNHWEAPTYMVSVEDTSLRGAGANLKNAIWDAARSIIEKWTEMELKPTSLYGIRVYSEGAILNPHVDRFPLVSSAIVNVAQDVDEPWPLEVYDRTGNAVNVTMEPGDMVLYESHSLIHGRPFPLKGRYYANVFIHFEPVAPLAKAGGEQQSNGVPNGLPPYIIPGSPEESAWQAQHNPKRNKQQQLSPRLIPEALTKHLEATTGHSAAATGDLERLSQLAKSNEKALHHKDNNGWQPLHEAVRGGHVDAVHFLVDLGADYNARTNGGKGGTPLHLAITSLSEDHPVSKYLMEMGALNIEPEL